MEPVPPDTTALPERRAREEREQLIARIATEYREMAGLSLTHAQACKLFCMEPDRCTRIIAELARRGIASVTPDGLIVRYESPPEGVVPP